MYTFFFYLTIVAVTMALLPYITNLIARFAGQDVDPVKNRKSVSQHALAAEQVFKWLNVILTGIGFFILGKSFALAYDLPVPVANLIGVFAFVASGWVTDFSFTHFLEDAIYQFLVFFRGDWKAGNESKFVQTMRAIRFGLVASMVTLLFAADYYSIYLMKSPVAEASRPAATINMDSVARSANERTREAIAVIDRDIDGVKKSISEKTAAIHTAHPELSALISKGNAWAPGELKRITDKATKADNDRLSLLQARKDAEYTRQSGITDQVTAIAAQSNKSATTLTEANKSAMSGMFSTFGIGSKVLTILLRIFLVVSFLANPHDADGDGKVDGKDVTAAAKRGSKPTPSVAIPEAAPAIAIAEAPRRPIGFYRDPAPPDAEATELLSKSGLFSTGAATAPAPPVAPPPVAPVVPVQQVIQPATNTVEILQKQPVENEKRGSTWILANLNDWKTYYGTYSRRAVESATEEGRAQNTARAQAYKSMIAAVGYEVYFQPNQKPKVQTIPIPGFQLDPESAKSIINAQLATIREMSPKGTATT